MLFIENSYLKNFNAEIVYIKDNKIRLDQTAFYAKSGGQPGDIGILNYHDNTVEIIDTIKDSENNILHITNNIVNLKQGDKISGHINWDLRYKHMRMHSALHLLCSVVPFGVTGGQIGFNKSRLDFDLEDNLISKDEIQEKINELLKKNYKIDYQWITQKELDEQPELVRTMSVKPPRINQNIRLVKIGNIDLQPCGGTHVKTTNEIGKITIQKIENKGKRNRRINISLN